jgi:hypothetical protein
MLLEPLAQHRINARLPTVAAFAEARPYSCSSPVQSDKGRLWTSLPRDYILPSIPGQFSIPVNFAHNPILAELALKASHQKILKMKPPDDPYTLLEVFVFR